MFPTTVRAAVIDSSHAPNADPIEVILTQAETFENNLGTFLAQCSAFANCAFHNDGDAEGAFDELMLQLDDAPIPSIEGRPDITRGVALTAVDYVMNNNPHELPHLWAALDAAQRGEGGPLLQGYDLFFEYNGDGTWPNLFEAFQTIRCMDSDKRLTVEQEDAIAARFREVSPRIFPGTTGGYGGYFCTFFPMSTDPRIEITGAGAGPILVCGTTGDSNPPLQSTRSFAETVEDGYLIVVDAPGAGCWRESQCANDLITDYLIDLDIPASSETNCPAG
jgi:hypothetical protein